MSTRKINGATIRALREAIGVRAQVFATDCGISPGYLTNIEKGRRQPAPDIALRMAYRLGVTLDAITYPPPVDTEMQP